ncbi:hypothetical protein BD626DRAFT_506470 [Schizophyllum amplum]|uniref:Uncharacterized protein n=1 Tax=Schizophyllum amplum TaxID=97359 RepID=A0A550C4T0_9AGAR|nr:hypothetical protein BD626DRAFT_506470 [Auriculariopsis ampla]
MRVPQYTAGFFDALSSPEMVTCIARRSTCHVGLSLCHRRPLGKCMVPSLTLREEGPSALRGASSSEDASVC